MERDVKSGKIKAVRPRRRDLLMTMLAPLLLPGAALAQSKPPVVRTKSASTVHFRVDVPEKDWRLVSGGINTLGIIVHKDGAAAVLVEHEALQIALKPEEVDATFADLEASTIKERETTGTGFTSRVEKGGATQRAVVDFQRRSPSGLEQVRLFVLVNGKHLYRLVCVAPAAQFKTFEPAFQAVASSFTPLDPPA
jgi:hypothetical protein